MEIIGFFSPRLPFNLRAAHTHANHEFYYCLGGCCRQTTSAGEFLMRPGDLCVLPLGMEHCATAVSADNSTAWVFNADDDLLSGRHSGDREARAILEMLVKQAEKGKCLLPHDASRGCEVYMRAIAEESQKQRTGWRAAAKAAFMQLLCALFRGWPADAAPLGTLAEEDKAVRMRAVFAYLESNYMKPLTVEDLLPLAHLGRSQFHAVFAEEAGCTFKTYLHRLRIAQAEKLLRESSLPVVQIALGCGFNSLSQFYVVFKQYRGIPPRQIRAGNYPGYTEPPQGS